MTKERFALQFGVVRGEENYRSLGPKSEVALRENS
jgi:hypothetical protein